MSDRNSYFGTPADIEAARAIRREQVLAWGKNVIAEADRAKFGDSLNDWDNYYDQPVSLDSDETDTSPEITLPEPAVEEPAPEPVIIEAAQEKPVGIEDVKVPVTESKTTKSTSKGSTTAK